jgi:xylan 1,4-beta-xylosidase
MVWNYHDDAIPGDDATVTIVMKNIPFRSAVLHTYSIDDEHSNAYEVWKKMGSPQHVSDEQYKVLEKAGGLQETEAPKKVSNEEEAVLRFRLPLHGVSLLRWSW